MIVPYPLTKANRIRLAGAFRQVPKVDLSIPCVLEAQMGAAFVDDRLHPQVFKIQVGPFLYFAGNAASPAGGDFIREIAPYQLIMPSSLGWAEAVMAAFPQRVCSFPRFSFSSAGLSAQHLQTLKAANSFNGTVQHMERSFVESVWQQDHFVDLSDYDSVEDFLERGIGFCAFQGADLAGAAYASLVCSQGIEVSIFVQPEYRRKGAATLLASHLLLWALENGLDAHWDAANLESCQLAEKLGYQPAGSYVAYYLAE